jgi:hypothetical protein
MVTHVAAGSISTFTATGCALWFNGALNHYFKPVPGSTLDTALNAISWVAALLTGAWAGECVQHRMKNLDTPLEGSWIALCIATAASTLVCLVHHTREAPEVKKGKKT